MVSFVCELKVSTHGLQMNFKRHGRRSAARGVRGRATARLGVQHESCFDGALESARGNKRHIVISDRR